MIEVDKYNVLIIDEWNGKYSLSCGWIGRDGDWKPNFVKEKYGAKGEKDVPKRILLGVGKEQAMHTLEQLMEAVTHNNEEPF